MNGQSYVLRGRFVPKKWITAVTLVLIAAESGAEKTPVLPSDPLSAGTLTQLVLGMVLVLGLIVASAWVLRRFNRFQSAASGQLKVVGGLSTGARERVVLVQIGDQQLLLGVAPGRVQTLHVLDEPLSQTHPNTTTGDGSFAQRLQNVLSQGGGK